MVAGLQSWMKREMGPIRLKVEFVFYVTRNAISEIPHLGKGLVGGG